MDLPQEVVDKFIEESKKRREQLVPLIAGLALDPTDKSLYQPAYDIFHKIHGSAEIFGHKRLGDIAGHFEIYLADLMAKGKLLDEHVVEFMKKTYELFEYCIEGRCDEEALDALLEEFSSFMEKL